MINTDVENKTAHSAGYHNNLGPGNGKSTCEEDASETQF